MVTSSKSVKFRSGSTRKKLGDPQPRKSQMKALAVGKSTSKDTATKRSLTFIQIPYTNRVYLI